MKSIIVGLFRLSRPDLSFAAGLCVVLGELLAFDHLPALCTVMAGFFSVACISAAILVMNDCLDVATDMINAPLRPIPSGMVSKTQAAYFAAALFIFGLGLSFTISVKALAAAMLLTVVGISYNRYFKKSGILGNLLVSFSVGMTFIYGGIAVGNPGEKSVLSFAIVTALIDLGEEIAADAMDAEGDKLIHSKSIAIRHGKNSAVNIATMIFVSIIFLTTIPFVMGWFSIIYALPLGMLDVLIIVAVAGYRNTEGDKARTYLKWLYRGGTGTLLIFLIMKLAHI